MEQMPYLCKNLAAVMTEIDVKLSQMTELDTAALLQRCKAMMNQCRLVMATLHESNVKISDRLNRFKHDWELPMHTLSTLSGRGGGGGADGQSGQSNGNNETNGPIGSNAVEVVLKVVDDANGELNPHLNDHNSPIIEQLNHSASTPSPSLLGSLSQEPGSSSFDSNAPYQCSRCSKVLSNRGNLDRHFREIHLREQPFQCTLCGHRFAQKGNLKAHMKRRHPCEFCTTPNGTGASGSACHGTGGTSGPGKGKGKKKSGGHSAKHTAAAAAAAIAAANHLHNHHHHHQQQQQQQQQHLQQQQQQQQHHFAVKSSTSSSSELSQISSLISQQQQDAVNSVQQLLL